MALEHTPIDVSQLSPAVAKVAAQGVAGPAKMMAARGMAPLGPRDLATALYQLSVDPDPQVAEAAAKTAGGLPENILGAALAEPLDPRVLDFFSKKVLRKPPLIERILLNPAIHDETLCSLGRELGEREVEILAGNQQRMLACPAIIEAIYFNRQARMSTVNRLMEMAVRNRLTLDLPQFKEIAASILGKTAAIEEEEPPPTAEDEEAMDAAFAAALEEGDETVGEMEFDEVEEEQVKGLYDLLKQPVTSKIRMATIGNALHRSILIKDTNKMVAMAVIKSSGVTDQEASRYAANRALNEEVIRFIANKKEWHKNYQIKVSLVNNPKCPLAQSMRLLTHLRPNDVRSLARSKNIPAALAQAAKQMLRKRS